MYVYIKSSLFSEKEYYRSLDRILHFFEDGKHDWAIDSDEEIDDVLESEWMKSHGNRIQAVIAEFSKRAFNDLLYTPKNKRKTRSQINVNSTQGDFAIAIDFAIRYLNEPLYLVVENEFSDSSFLNAIINSFKNKGKRIKKALNSEWIVYYNAGGKGMIKNIIRARSSRIPLPIRMFVLCDSDKKKQLDSPLSTEELIDVCNEFLVNYHVLEKREIENYLPKEVFYHLPNEMSTIVDAYESLSPEQKDYYDLSEGYTNRRNTIYENLSDELHNKLKFGFQNSNFNPKKELYLLFEHYSVNNENLLERCNHQDDPNELISILEKINELL